MASGFKKATVNAGSVAATLANYPAYVDLSRIGISTLAEAQSVRVYSDITRSTELSREIVSASEMHVKIPSLTTTTEIYVFWDGVSSDYAVSDTYGRNAVWSDYLVVYHMNEDPSGSAPQMVDSTGNGLDAASSGTMTSGDLVSAQIGNGLDFDGTDDLISAASSDTGFLGALTLTIWANIDTGSNYRHFMGKHSSAGATANPFDFRTDNAATPSINLVRANTTSNVFTGPATVVGSWRKYTATLASGNAQEVPVFYVNAASTLGIKSSGTATGAVTGSAAALRIGRRADNFLQMDGKVDEARIKASAVTANWETTEFNNQSAESTFWGSWSVALPPALPMHHLNQMRNQ